MSNQQPLHQERIGDWTPAQLAGFIRQTIQSDPTVIPASLKVRTLTVMEALYYKNQLQ